MIPMSFNATMFSFSQTVTVEDYVGAHSMGVWSEEPADPPTREIRAVVLQMSDEELKAFPGGDSSEGGIGILTDEELYFADVTEEGQECRQSYILYGGYKWKVRATGLFRFNTTHNSYSALRYLV